MDQTIHIVYTPIDQLAPYQRNARIHGAKQIEQIVRSIQAFGWMNPIIVDAKNTVIAGHGRLLAAKQLNLQRVPVIRAEHLSEAQVRAYRIADNRLAERAEWDRDLLKVELADLASIDLDFDVELTGFDTPEIDVLLDEISDESIDDFPMADLPAPEQVVSRPGDLWLLGPHRLICADARDVAALDRLMAGRPAGMSFSDPPYNVPIAGHVSGLGQHQHREFAAASGELSPDAFVRFLSDSLGNLARVSMDGAIHAVCMDWRHIAQLLRAGGAVYTDLLNLCVWCKTNGGMGSLYRSQHELVAIFKVGNAPHVNNVQLGRHGRYRTNVWEYAGMNSFSAERTEALALHPTVKPIRLVADAILDVTDRGDRVLDGFAGSGTTILAAEQVGRIAYAVELDAAYVDVIVRRWRAATNDAVVLEGADLTFEAVAAKRLSAVEEVQANG